jgi:hypothetical protein
MQCLAFVTQNAGHHQLVILVRDGAHG